MQRDLSPRVAVQLLRGSFDPTAVVMNVTVDRPTAASYLTVWPGARAMPGTSNVNFAAGETTANLIVVRIGADRRTNFFNGFGSTHVIADVVGYFD